MQPTGGRVIPLVCQRLRTKTIYLKLAIRPVSVSCQQYAKEKGAEGSGPIPFSSSKAATWTMTNSVIVPKQDVPWYQTVSISLSVLGFMLYFFFVREENDLDVELNYSLFERLPQLEEQQVKVALDNHRRLGYDTRDLEKRLADIQRSKQTQ
ncbi:hypothetical protein ACOMHN_045007 [Nucella lapillus]